MPKELDDAGVEIKAISYILIGIIQRLDAAQPGFTSELLDGVRADREAVVSRGDAEITIENIFDKAINLLERAGLHNSSADLT